ncbi:MAG: DUF2141 domain-containing protein [Betaproteobacteria bacterium]|nr:DUF2141 domain-containing protein [Betaproteobacteria bacterium]
MAGRQHLRAAIATLALAAGAVPLAAAADLVVELGVKDPGQGFVYVALYAKAADWMKTAMKSGRQELLSGRARLSFAGLEPGEYAISAYFDANGNGKLDAGFLGRPVEPFGFSNGAQGAFGAPAFDKARFRLDASGTTVAIELK